MLIFLQGNDPYRIRQRSRWYRDGFEKKYAPAKAQVFFGDESKVEEVAAFMRAGGLFAKKIMLVVHDLIQRQQAAGKRKIDGFLKDWDASENVLILTEVVPTDWQAKKTLTENALWKKLTALPHAEAFPLLTGYALTRWIGQEASRLGVAVEPAAVQLLAAKLGSDLWAQHSALSLLAAYRSGQAVRPQDVEELVRGSVDEDIFGLIDAVAGKRFAEAQERIAAQLGIGADPHEILARVQKHVGYLLQAVGERISPETLAKQAGVHPFVAKKVVAQAVEFSPTEVLGLAMRLVQAERDLKTTSLSAGVVFMRALGGRER